MRDGVWAKHCPLQMGEFMIEVILHHSLTKDSGTKSFDAIKKYHKEVYGWSDIGYHYIIELYGDSYITFKGRAEATVGAHTQGHNTGTIGICLVGNFDETKPSADMLKELYRLLDDIASRYGGIKVSGHNEYSTKTCPGKLFPLKQIKELYKSGYRVKPTPTFLTLSLNGVDYQIDNFKNIDGSLFVGLREILTDLGYKNIKYDGENLKVVASK